MIFNKKQQLALTFSYMAYLGFGKTGSDRENANQIQQLLEQAIADWPLTDNDWELVWGPGLFALPGTLFDDAFLFMVRKKSDPNQYYIAIRGTNPISIPNWVIWDFQGQALKAWPFVEPTETFQPKISESTNFGFNVIYSLRPPIGVPGAQKTLIEFLDEELLDKPKAQVCVTGHSLGGALSPTVALWLTDVQQEHAFASAEFSVVSFAGPTPGDQDFAKHCDQQLAGRCERIANDLDVVTYGWQSDDLARLPTLYAGWSLPLIYPLPPTYAFIKHLQSKAKHKNYQHLGEPLILQGKKYWPKLGLKGPHYAFALLYLGQAAYQHVWAYPQLMGLDDAIPVDELFSLEMIPTLLGSLVKV